MRVILDYLRSHSILVCGKYGAWKDMPIPESIQSGMAAARETVGARSREG
jgi:hypothetical protein